MKFVGLYLVDEKVKGFLEWKRAIDAEDIKDLGHVVKRRDYKKSYAKYLEFQTSHDVIETRKYYYGE
jgi:hypothetical protein